MSHLADFAFLVISAFATGPSKATAIAYSSLTDIAVTLESATLFSAYCVSVVMTPESINTSSFSTASVTYDPSTCNTGADGTTTVLFNQNSFASSFAAEPERVFQSPYLQVSDTALAVSVGIRQLMITDVLERAQFTLSVEGFGSAYASVLSSVSPLDTPPPGEDGGYYALSETAHSTATLQVHVRYLVPGGSDFVAFSGNYFEAFSNSPFGIDFSATAISELLSFTADRAGSHIVRIDGSITSFTNTTISSSFVFSIAG